MSSSLLVGAIASLFQFSHTLTLQSSPTFLAVDNNEERGEQGNCGNANGVVSSVNGNTTPPPMVAEETTLVNSIMTETID